MADKARLAYADGDTTAIVYADAAASNPFIVADRMGNDIDGALRGPDGEWLPSYLADGSRYFGRVTDYYGIQHRPAIEPSEDTSPESPSPGEDAGQPDTPGDTSPGDGGESEDTSPEDTPPPATGGDMPTVEDLRKFSPEDAEDAEQAEIMLNSAVAMVDAYTRGRHVNRAGELRPGVSAVILTTAARLLANPGQVSRGDTAGQFSTRRGPGFSGFTLAEQAVLNRYRKRAAG